jgi:carbon monoxide dehydrogenase subunit G
MPGCEEARQLDARRYEAVLATKVQFMTIRARTTGTLLEAEEPTHLVVEMVGETLAMAGAFRALMTVDLHPIDESTHVQYTFDFSMFGRLGSLGEPIVRSTAQRLAGQFADNVASLFRAGQGEAESASA